MLSVLDQHWREHLYEMDYLQQGINLRAMGQRDPLTEWQREGFDMFEAMMGRIEDDFVRYVFHLQVVVEEQPQPQLRDVRYSAAEDPVQGAGAIRTAGRSTVAGPAPAPPAAPAAAPAGPARAGPGGPQPRSSSPCG
ncbi:MAG: hypothetical protein KatS3mg009_1411 [Acidimicrobiia bacterium]|nr:MAG: hypothetical protein KatS3mg009_1411 [Acidimicrobiia bacterium]